MTRLNLDAKSEYLSWIAYLRHELYTPLNAIHGYSELLIEELEDTNQTQEELAQQLNDCNQIGGLILKCISQAMNGDRLCVEIERATASIPASAGIDVKLRSSFWARLIQEVFLEHLWPLSADLAQASSRLSDLAPSKFDEDINKILIAVGNLQRLISAVLQSEAWPCELRLQASGESQNTETQDCYSVPPMGSNSKKTISTSLNELSGTTASVMPRDLSSTQAGQNRQSAQGIAPKLVEEATETLLDQVDFKDTAANVLVVDDNGANCDLLCRYIIRQGHQAFPVDSGLEALKQIKTGAYDLVLLDILMPEMNGYEVLEWIRNGEWHHLSVIMISSLDEIDSVVKCIEMGAEDYLPKPFNPVLLKARVDACLNKKRMRDKEVQYLDKLAIANSQITSLNAQLQAENGRLSAELDVSRKIQQMMLPRPQELAQIEDLDLVGFMKPADEIGGDYYDVIRRDDAVIIGIGDVTGHGLESGLLMLMIQTAVRTLVEQGGCDHKAFLDIINRTILSNAERMETSRNSTLSLIRYHAGKLRISGQHEEVIIIREHGLIEHIDTIDLGFPIGLDEDIYGFLGKTEVELNLKDVVILYTDGITEAESPQGQFYGIERLSQVAAQHRFDNASVIRDAVVNDLIQHIDNCKIFDDITLVVMKRSA